MVQTSSPPQTEIPREGHGVHGTNPGTEDNRKIIPGHFTPVSGYTRQHA